MTPDHVGKYELRGKLPGGAMAAVYDGWDPTIPRRVAIKTVHLADAAADEEAAEALARFRREAQAAGRLSHPNIVAVYDTGETDELAYLVMEFVEGRSLKAVLDQEKTLPPSEIAEIMGQVLAGLEYSHRRGIIHRDIKPANVMLTAEGLVKLVDFGIARIATSSATSVGAILGTPAYMPPEQFLGEPADARSDIYAAGAMLFHLLTGTRPFEGGPAAIMSKVLNAPAAPSPSERAVGVSPAWDGVIGRAMARRPADRFPSADAFAAAIRIAAAAAPWTTDADATIAQLLPPATVAPRGAMESRRQPWIAGGAVLLLAAVAAGWFALSRGRPAPPPKLAFVPPKPMVVAQAPQPPPRPSLRCETAMVMWDGAAWRFPPLAGTKPPTDAAYPEPLSPAFCPLLDVLWPYLKRPSFDLTLATGSRPLGEGEGIAPVIGPVPFDGWLEMDYVDTDGRVFRLKQPGNAAKHPAKQTPRKDFLTNQPVSPDPMMRAAPPFGMDMLVAIATQAPLEIKRSEKEDPTEYLRQLAAALHQLDEQNASIAVNVLFVSTKSISEFLVDDGKVKESRATIISQDAPLHYSYSDTSKTTALLPLGTQILVRADPGSKLPSGWFVARTPAGLGYMRGTVFEPAN